MKYTKSEIQELLDEKRSLAVKDERTASEIARLRELNYLLKDYDYQYFTSAGGGEKMKKYWIISFVLAIFCIITAFIDFSKDSDWGFIMCLLAVANLFLGIKGYSIWRENKEHEEIQQYTSSRDDFYNSGRKGKGGI